MNLNPDRSRRLHRSVRDVNHYLKCSLPNYQAIDRQGSYALDTLIKPANEEDGYDADIQVVMNPNPNWEPRDYLNVLYSTLYRNHNFVGKLKRGTRCVTIDYAGEFHLDVVPRITDAGKHSICNGATNKLEGTDGAGYRNWFSEKSRITKGNLKRVVRLLKYIRDRQHNYVAKSILLTTLCGNAIRPTDQGTESVRTIASTLTTVLMRMDGYLQRNQRMPRVQNPAMDSEDFNRHWDQASYTYFSTRVHSHAQIAREALATPSIEGSIRIWRRLLGNEFGGRRIP